METKTEEKVIRPSTLQKVIEIIRECISSFENIHTINLVELKDLQSLTVELMEKQEAIIELISLLEYFNKKELDLITYSALLEKMNKVKSNKQKLNFYQRVKYYWFLVSIQMLDSKRRKEKIGEFIYTNDITGHRVSSVLSNTDMGVSETSNKNNNLPESKS